MSSSRLYRVVLGKLGGALAAIFGASIIAFVFMRVLPGDPSRLIAGPLASEEAIEATRTELGLDDPIHVQYVTYISDFFRGDWGFSFGAGAPVADQIAARLPASVELGLYAFVFSFLAAVVLALVATYRHRPVVDGSVRALSFFGLGTPPFWFALILLIVFFEELGWLPGPEGRLATGSEAPPGVTGLYTVDALLAGELGTFVEAIRHLVLPSVALGLGVFAFLVRLLRANLLEVGRDPFIVVARSKGIGRWTAFSRHALPNAFLPTLTAAGLLLAQLLAGSVLVEKVFNWPGVGALVVDSILRQDFAVVQAFILLAAFSYVVVNLVVDLLYGVIDPRVRAPSAAR
jgi:ABC-type dipeptide/oligopeptide/nickel transport system permease component